MRLKNPIPSVLIIGSVAAGFVATLSCNSDRVVQLRSEFAARISESDAETIGLYFYDFDNGDSVAIGAETLLHAASMMKVPVMIQLFRDVDSRKLSLEDSVTITNTFHSIVDSSTYELSDSDDSDSTLYGKLGEKATLGELVELMITVSSNLAATILIEHLDVARIQSLTRALEAHSMMVLRGVEDIKAYEAGMNNRTTARDMGLLFRAIGDGTAASDSSCREMIEILSRQEFNSGIPAGLPRDIRVAHKTGRITRINHDGGIIYAGSTRSYVLVVLTGGMDDPTVSDALIADLSRIAFQSVSR
ncbi:MAG: class A beta-lactamase-related serine hydrolase [Gemmatimonadales bacterium]